MVRYETLFLTRTEITEEESTLIEKHLEKLLTEAQGTLDFFDKWGKYRLAYPVNKNSHGVYILTRYQIPSKDAEKVLSEFDRFLKIKCHEIVMRYVNIKLIGDAAKTYIKPDPIDISRSGSLDSFLKGNNVETLLNSVESGHSKDMMDENHDDEDGQA